MTKRWINLRCLLALALLLVSGYATAETPSKLTVWAQAAIGTLPVFHEDREAAGKSEQLAAIGEAVAKASYGHPRSPREWSALLLTIGYHESTFSLRIHRGDCRQKECDAGRARSPFQMHRNDFTAPVWDKLFGLEHTEIQVRAASEALERGYWTCARSGVPWLQGTINGYAGRRCGDAWPGLDKRVATFERLSRVRQPKATAGGAS